MALEIRSTPILTGETAERFVREAEEMARNPQLHTKHLRLSFAQIDEILERSRKCMQKNGGKSPFAK
jgi:hypothetical protein